MPSISADALKTFSACRYDCVHFSDQLENKQNLTSWTNQIFCSTASMSKLFWQYPCRSAFLSSPDNVHCSGPINLAPRLYVVPAELAPFNHLFTSFGAPLEFNATQYSHFLADLASTFQSKPLPAKELEQALAVAQVSSSLQDTVRLGTSSSKPFNQESCQLSVLFKDVFNFACCMLRHPELLATYKHGKLDCPVLTLI